MMRRKKVDVTMHIDDQLFIQKYVPLSLEYLKSPASHANLDDVKDGFVDIKEAEYITNYSGHVSELVKRNLKNATIERTLLIKEYDINLFKSLCRLPGYDGQTVYRMERTVSSIQDYQNYFSPQVGKVMSVPYYLSTSKEDWQSTEVVYVIKTLADGSNGKDISRITNFALEKEVLFLKNTNFRIISLKVEKSILYIEMEETADAGDFVYNYFEIGFHEKSLESAEEQGMFDD